jgi:F-type H+-transporting ATPase subunit beta
LSIYCGVGERIREGNELYETLRDTDVLKNTVMFFGQMDATPAIRSMVGPAAATAAEYFRDEEGRDILFFVDNIYRHVQAMTELSTNLGLIPSEGGYSPMVFSDLRRLQDRLASTEQGTITSVQAIYVPADDLSDPAVQAISQQLDSVLVLDRSIAEQGIRPAVNLLKTTSSLLTPQIVGERHYRLAEKVQAIMQKYDSLKNIIAIVGENELSPADRTDYQNAKKLIQFFSQDFAVAEKFSGKPGEYYTLEQTLDGIEEILNGNDKPAKPQDTEVAPEQPAANGSTPPAATPPTPAKTALRRTRSMATFRCSKRRFLISSPVILSLHLIHQLSHFAKKSSRLIRRHANRQRTTSKFSLILSKKSLIRQASSVSRRQDMKQMIRSVRLR